MQNGLIEKAIALTATMFVKKSEFISQGGEPILDEKVQKGSKKRYKKVQKGTSGTEPF